MVLLTKTFMNSITQFDKRILNIVIQIILTLLGISVGVCFMMHHSLSRYEMDQVKLLPYQSWGSVSLTLVDSLTITVRDLNEIDEIIIHHTATEDDMSPQHLESVHLWLRKFSMIGYHFLITREGVIYEGRPLDIVGAHTIEHNSNSIGIVLIGNFSQQFPSYIQLISLSALTRSLKENYGIENVSLHRNYNSSTECPGDRLTLIIPFLPL